MDRQRGDADAAETLTWWAMTAFVPTVRPLRTVSDGLLKHGFDLYRALLSGRSEDDLVLLESLGVESVDARSTYIGIDPVLSLAVYGLDIRIRAHAALAGDLRIALAAHACVVAEDGALTCRLERHEGIWDFLRAFETAFEAGHADGAAPLALFGYLGYDTVRYIESLPRHQAPLADVPDMALSLYRTVVALDDDSARLTHYRFEGDDQIDLDAIVATCERAFEGEALDTDPASYPHAVRFETSRPDYLRKCERAMEHIRIGDIYQIQIGQKVRVDTGMPPLVLYARLRALNPSPYMYLFRAEGHTIVGASPELYMRIDGDTLVMRPIAGTVGKVHVSTVEDARHELHGSEKEVAEHLMLVDLCRNDICRVCEPESLRVEELMDIEEYSHVFHMVTNASGRMRAGRDKYDAIRASFPAGTMTGTPKVRAIELIEEIEDSARGHYAGIVGLIGICSDFMNTALCIRSAVHRDGTYTLRASAGMVADSRPESEYAETLHKLGSVYVAITGKELTCAAE